MEEKYDEKFDENAIIFTIQKILFYQNEK